MFETFLHKKIVRPTQIVESRRELVRQLLEQEGPITHKEISAYVDALLKNIKRFSDPHEKVLFLLQDLRTDLVLEDAATMPMYKDKRDVLNHFFARFIKEDDQEKTHRTVLDEAMKEDPREEPLLTREHIEAVLQPIRRAVFEELKKRLTEEQSLGHINYSDVQFMLGAIEEQRGDKTIRHKNVQEAQDLQGINQGVIVRVEKAGLEYLTEAEIRHREEAIKKLIKILPNEHILPITKFLPEEKLWISPKEEGLHTLGTIHKSPELPALEIFAVIRDCMVGARTLEKNGLVLQDIKLDNLGYVNRRGEPVGVLFDLDGIYPVGEELHVRFCQRGVNEVPEFEYMRREMVESSEMVYQFGLCLFQAFVSRKKKIPEEIASLITALHMDMKAYDRDAANPLKRRISLEEALIRLDSIIKLLEATPVRRAAVA